MAEPDRPTLIPFYGATDRALFEIERRCMDRDGVILSHLDAVLPRGAVLDVGAGDGFMAERLAVGGRRVIAAEPAAGMVEPSRPLPWVRALAQALPLRADCLDGAYATFAYFFPSIGHGDAGLAEVERVLRPGAPFVFIDSAGGDELTRLANPDDANRGMDVASPRAWWIERGFEATPLETSFRFDTLEEARRLLGHFYGKLGRAAARLEVGFRAVAWHRTV